MSRRFAPRFGAPAPPQPYRPMSPPAAPVAPPIPAPGIPRPFVPSAAQPPAATEPPPPVASPAVQAKTAAPITSRQQEKGPAYLRPGYRREVVRGTETGGLELAEYDPITGKEVSSRPYTTPEPSERQRPAPRPTMEPAATPPEYMPSTRLPAPAPAKPVPARPSVPVAEAQASQRSELYPTGKNEQGQKVYTQAELKQEFQNTPSPMAQYRADKAAREKAEAEQRLRSQRNSAYPYRYKSQSDRYDASREAANTRFYGENAEDGSNFQRMPTDREAQQLADSSYRQSGRTFMPRITSNSTFPGQVNPNVGRADVRDPYGGPNKYGWQGKDTPQGNTTYRSYTVNPVTGKTTVDNFSVPRQSSQPNQGGPSPSTKKPARVVGIYDNRNEPGGRPRFFSYQPEYEGDTRGLDFKEDNMPLVQGGDGRVRTEVPGYVVKPWERSVGGTQAGYEKGFAERAANASKQPETEAPPASPTAPNRRGKSPAAPSMNSAPPAGQSTKPKQSAPPSGNSAPRGSTRPSGIPNATPPTGVNGENWSGIGDNETFNPRDVRPRGKPQQPWVQNEAPRISQVEGPTATVDGEFGEEAPTVNAQPSVTVPNQYRQSIAQKVLGPQRIGGPAPGQSIRRLPEGPGRFIRRSPNALGTTRPAFADTDRLLQGSEDLSNSIGDMSIDRLSTPTFTGESFGDTRPQSLNFNPSVLPNIMALPVAAASAVGGLPGSTPSIVPTSGGTGAAESAPATAARWFVDKFPTTPGGLVRSMAETALRNRLGGINKLGQAVRAATEPTTTTDDTYAREAVAAPGGPEGGPAGMSYPPSSMPPQVTPEVDTPLDAYGRRKARYMPANELAENYNNRASSLGWNPVEMDANGFPVMYGREGQRLAGPALEKAMFDRLQSAIYRQNMNGKNDAWDRIRANRAAQNAGYANALEMNTYTHNRLPTAVRGNQLNDNREFTANLLPALLSADPSHVADMMPAIQAAQTGNMGAFTQAMGQVAQRGQRRQQAMDVIRSNPGRAQQIAALMDSGFSPQEIQGYIPGGISESDQVELRRRTAPDWMERNRNVPANVPIWDWRYWANLAGNVQEGIYNNPASPFYDPAYEAERNRKARAGQQLRNLPASRSGTNTTRPSR